MNSARLIAVLSFCLICSQATAQNFTGSIVTIPGGTATLGMAEEDYAAPPPFNAPFHTVTLSAFQMSASEVTNQQYVDFLNGALEAGLVEVHQETARGPDEGSTLVYGTSAAPEVYREQAMLNLSGTRVMKDHDNDDGDNDSFTGVIEPENPLNISYIGYDEARSTGDKFYVKDPADPADFDWMALTNYHNYTSETHQLDTSETLNDYADWNELADFPNNMPMVDEVRDWPATFIRWYGAKAFALYYGLDLPTEAEWEYAAQGGAEFAYATSDGAIHGDGTSAVWNHTKAKTALGHVLDVKTGDPNPYGLYNMAGNAWEWVEDWYAADFYQDATDPVNTTDTGVKVRRGGSWNYHQFTLLSSSRAWDEQFKGNDHFGFRVVNRALETSVKEPDGVDFDGNDRVDFSDFFLFADAFGGSDPDFDLDDSGSVDFGDFFLFADSFGADAQGKLIALAREYIGLPVSSSMDQNYPNPFNSSTTVRYYVGETDLVRVDVFDLSGQKVKSLVRTRLTPGFYQISWDGMDEQGLKAASGIYLTRLQVGNSSDVRKMTLVK